MDSSSATESAFEQAKKYGEDLAKLYALEKVKRVNLQISNQKLQAIFSTTPDGLAVLDQELNIEEANPAFWSLVEQPPSQNAIPLVHILPYPELVDQLTNLSSPTQAVPQIEIDLPLTHTLWRSLLINAVPLSAGDKRGWVLSVHDLTERKRLENLKSEFINIAAHELRTPLAAILGFSQVLKESLEEKNYDISLHLIQTILKSSNRLKDIIDELIEFADIRYQTESPQATDSFDLIAVIQEVVQANLRSAQEKKLTIETTFNSKTLQLNGNRNIIKEALRHLIENAIIFNKPQGKIFIRATENGDAATVEIEDTGIGIAQKELDKIFDKFYQVEEHLTRSVGGLGLGLAIAQRGIQLHGGDITVTSKLNEGSCFTITLLKSSQVSSTDFDSGLKDAYEQTLAYGRDLAKAVTAERTMAQKLEKYQAARRQLLQALEDNLPIETIQTIVDQMEASE